MMFSEVLQHLCTSCSLCVDFHIVWGKGFLACLPYWQATKSASLSSSKETPFTKLYCCIYRSPSWWKYPSLLCHNSALVIVLENVICSFDRFKAKHFSFIFNLNTSLPSTSLIKHHMSSNITLKPCSISWPILSKFWSILGTYRTSVIYFKPVKFSIATVLFPLAEINSPFPILTLETIFLSSSLKSSRSLVMWFVHPLSINQESLELLLVVKHVITESWSSSRCSVEAFTCSCCWDLKIRSMGPFLPHFLRLTSGLHPHFLCGWFIFLQCGHAR